MGRDNDIDAPSIDIDPNSATLSDACNYLFDTEGPAFEWQGSANSFRREVRDYHLEVGVGRVRCGSSAVEAMKCKR